MLRGLVLLLCVSPSISATNRVRLVGGTEPWMGRVEVKYDGRWGTVCDDYWGEADARVVCRELGFNSTAPTVQDSSVFGAGSGSIYLDDVGCQGNESSIWDCPANYAVTHCNHDEDVGITCEADTNRVRLVGGTEPWMGRVEVKYNGKWGTVCDDYWGEADARVVCRELGYDSTAPTVHDSSVFGAGSGSIYLDDVGCQGNESSIWDCPANYAVTHCNHDEDVGITCGEDTNRVRLVGGTEPWMGRVEVKYNGKWGTVCDDYWGEADARVVCRELGFNSKLPTVHDSSFFGAGSGSIYLDDVGCQGNESSIWDCPANYAVTHCNHDEDVGITCGADTKRVRLVGGTEPWMGRVEVNYNGKWGTVCDDYWGEADARVVCRELGFNSTSPTVHDSSFFGAGSGSIFLDDVGCQGNESSIWDCPANSAGVEYCNHDEDVGITCGADTKRVRLVGGTEPWMGRVEVKYNGKWGTVCDDYWGEADARVVCRELGFNSKLPTVHDSSVFGAGSGSIYLDDVDCQGNESSIWDCPANYAVTHCNHDEDVGITCGADTKRVRLVGGTEPWMGRVEVNYNGKWGTVCDDYWGEADAQVVCRELGYDPTSPTVHDSSFFGAGSGSIFLDDVSCQGNESSIWDCPANSAGVENCNHDEDVGITCGAGSGAQSMNITWPTARFESTTSMNLATTPTTNVRLVGGSEPWMGRVEVKYNGEWGTVCDDNWDETDARVVCRELGYDSTAATAHDLAFFGAGSGSIYLDEVICQGEESSIWDCPASSVGVTNCDHGEDAGVTCVPGSGAQSMNITGTTASFESTNSRNWATTPTTNVRLVGGSEPWMGRVEVKYNGEWGTVCDDNWDETDARVVCRELGYDSTAATAHDLAFFGAGSGSIYLDEVICQGEESSIWDCPASSVGVTNCDHGEDAGVTCVPGSGAQSMNITGTTARFESTTSMNWATTPSNTADSTIRLVDGSEPWTGRVEVNVNGDWGTVCDDDWDGYDARVVCRQLGYHSSPEAFTFGYGSGSIHLDDVRCRGDESSIWDCPASPVGSHNCKHSEDAGVSCLPVHTVVRLVGGSQPWKGRVEVSINGEWGTVCDDDWDETDARVVCRQLGFNSTTVTAHGSAFFGQGRGSTLRDDVNCQGSEISILECPATGQGGENCDHSEDAGVTCGAAP